MNSSIWITFRWRASSIEIFWILAHSSRESIKLWSSNKHLVGCLISWVQILVWLHPNDGLLVASSEWKESLEELWELINLSHWEILWNLAARKGEDGSTYVPEMEFSPKFSGDLRLRLGVIKHREVYVNKIASESSNYADLCCFEISGFSTFRLNFQSHLSLQVVMRFHYQ